MDVFGGPQVLNIADQSALLATPEGWLELKARWLSDDPQVTGLDGDPAAVRVLRIECDLCFRPRYEPSDKQDKKRLTWVSWSRK